jgi:hypothetical protein
VADSVRAQQVDSHRRGQDHRACEKGGALRAPSALALPRVPTKVTRTGSLLQTGRAPLSILLDCGRALADQAEDARVELGSPVQIVSRPPDQNSGPATPTYRLRGPVASQMLGAGIFCRGMKGRDLNNVLALPLTLNARLK